MLSTYGCFYEFIFKSYDRKFFVLNEFNGDSISSLISSSSSITATYEKFQPEPKMKKIHNLTNYRNFQLFSYKHSVSSQQFLTQNQKNLSSESNSESDV